MQELATLLAQPDTRLVTVFAEDRVQPEGVFYIYYVFERRGDPDYITLRSQIPNPQSPIPT